MAEEYLQVITTTDAKDAADQLARSIVEARLAACVQVLGPISATYWWEGKVESAEEWLLQMKTTADRYEALAEHIKTHHSYDTPEIVATPITNGSADYLSWVRAETRPRE
ncbi:hypothetical protein TH66_12365 [Carbonactinospora thermoautotrophica]|uniref:Divalent-cation tolerance protein CutA n=1 Tax=Carbonactinospora thermoautotrophica TaxID=1469144 RepID=A0A132NEY1_9ACTN|nr:divalent-cation tolerance protein CutA [Carbonactinospora thermoautotrophica]KWX03627.1 hypothetical protein TH66_12365 [Carbonactinospora thermoautotrophica]KWX08537.1 hypothetical protein TR74_14575 [Carbonactinospora thermoautotrophica]